MNELQRKQLKEARMAMIQKDLTSGKIAEELGTSVSIISQLIHGHNYYPRYAKAIFERYGIFIPDTRNLSRAA
jgi:hypothetical protein